MTQPIPIPARPGRARPDIRSILGWVVVTPWLAGLAAWGIGRLIGDRFLWSQYLEWIPTEAVVLSGLIVALLEALLRGRRAKRVRIPLLIVLSMLAWLLFAEWRLWRVLTPCGPEPHFRIAFANISPGKSPADLAPIFEMNADVVVLSNAHPNTISFERIYGFHPQELLERAVAIEPGEADPAQVHFLRQGSFRVLSRWPIRRRASAWVGPQETWIEGDIQSAGAIMTVELDSPQGPVVVWGIDLPRTIGASRRVLLEQTAERIASITTGFEVDEIGRWVAFRMDEDDRLLTPDIVVGDFNTPGHAWSVSRFLPDHRPVRHDAGVGPAGTWPVQWPLFEIDLVQIAPTLRATDTARVRMKGVRHLGLWADLRWR